MYIRPRKHTTDTNYIEKLYRLHFISKNHVNILCIRGCMRTSTCHV